MMYTPKEREQYFTRTIRTLELSENIEGVVQLGSGVAGYKDELSDIDLMVAAPSVADLGEAMSFLQKHFMTINSVYIKILQLRKNIYLIIAFLKNGLEFNVSVLPRELLSVKSPLWKVVVDKTGNISARMKDAQKQFEQSDYAFSDDIAFDFMYSMRKFQTELKRSNMIYALKMLETMREHTLQLQTLIEGKKLHQFKAFETLQTEFISEYLSTYPGQVTEEQLQKAAQRLQDLFMDTICRSKKHRLDERLNSILL
ncbi:aminoglycoside 6-adenylyltransferase [Bacillus sp. V3]|nr:aminoglycoside 6-adenylyltransferase [Bacillus sp. V3]